MVMTRSQMLELQTAAPDFDLPTPNGTQVRLSEMTGAKAYVVMFICNHCPYVKLLRESLAEFGRWCEANGVAIVAINPNDADKYPDDSPDRMRIEAETYGYTFPYVIDADQAVAKAYRAACTPDFYVFDADKKLAYRGQYDEARPGNGEEVTGADLRAATEAIAAGSEANKEQQPSIGCNIKWKDGNAPAYFG